MEIATIKEKAEQLYALRQEIGQIEERHAAELESLKKQRDLLQASLIEDMTIGEIASLKVASGETFTKAVRKSVAIVNEFMALEWAKEHGAVTVDTKIIAQKVKDGIELPADIFRPVETNYISVRKPTK